MAGRTTRRRQRRWRRWLGSSAGAAVGGTCTSRHSVRPKKHPTRCPSISVPLSRALPVTTPHSVPLSVGLAVPLSVPPSVHQPPPSGSPNSLSRHPSTRHQSSCTESSPRAKDWLETVCTHSWRSQMRSPRARSRLSFAACPVAAYFFYAVPPTTLSARFSVSSSDGATHSVSLPTSFQCALPVPPPLLATVACAWPSWRAHEPPRARAHSGGGDSASGARQQTAGGRAGGRGRRGRGGGCGAGGGGRPAAAERGGRRAVRSGVGRQGRVGRRVLPTELRVARLATWEVLDLQSRAARPAVCVCMC